MTNRANQEVLSELTRTIETLQGQFTLIFTCCNYAHLRDELVEQLQQQSSVEILSLKLAPSVQTLYSTISENLAEKPPAALMVFGLESVSSLGEVLTSANQAREEFRKNLPFPLVLWVNDRILREMMRLIPDFNSWAMTYKFTLSSDKLISFLEQSANRIFEATPACDRFLANKDILGYLDGAEIESAQQDLQKSGAAVSPELEANLKFIFGRNSYASNQLDLALEDYRESLGFWEQSNKERQGVLLLHIGWCHFRQSLQDQNNSQRYWKAARDAFQKCIGAFEEAGRVDLVARFICRLGEVLRSLEAWDELEAIAQKSLELHKTNGFQRELARDWGFRSEVALNRSQWEFARQGAEKALFLLSQIPVSQRQHQSRYLLLKARSLHCLGQKQAAIAALEIARREARPQSQRDARLYIQVLMELQSLYGEQKQYLKAFEVKQDRRSIEQQFRLRAFVGAGHLQPQLEQGELQQVAEAIAASGRDKDVNYLIDSRISLPRYNLTVLYGPSGVGKTSLLHGGLVPALEHRAIGDRRAQPIVLQAYGNWVKHLAELLQVSPDIPAIKAQLRANAGDRLLTVLIFDQFEEFFFVCEEPEQRQKFYRFLRDCLKGIEIPFVKTILCIQDNYISNLLEIESFADAEGFDDILGDLLGKDRRYYLDNFSAEAARLAIKTLTERVQFQLEPALIDALVVDLAKNPEEKVRPIELQLAGAQLQDDGITTLEQYQKLGQDPKAELAKRWLESTVNDCGAENAYPVWKILASLTDAKNRRTMRTAEDLARALGYEEKRADASGLSSQELVLNILVDSGLVVYWPDNPEPRYQLVHDYLVEPIRQKYQQEEVAWRDQKNANEGIVRQIQDARSLFEDGRELEALIEALKAGQRLKHLGYPVEAETYRQAVATLRQVLGDIKEYNRLEGHGGKVGAIYFSSDSQILASASGDNTVKLWRRDGTEISTLAGHSSKVSAVRFSPDGEIIASASGDNKVKLWRRDGSKIATLTGHRGTVSAVRFSPDSEAIATASGDNTAKLWRRDGTLITTLVGHGGDVNDVHFSPDGRVLATGSGDNTVRLWRRDGTEIITLASHGGDVNHVHFSPDGHILASASSDNTVKLWQIDGSEIITLAGHRGTVHNIRFSPDGEILASASGDNTVKLWQRNGSLIATLAGHNGDVNHVEFSPDGRTIATASGDNTVKLWQRDGTLIATLAGHGGDVNDVRFSFDGQILASGSGDNTVKLWKLESPTVEPENDNLDDLLACGYSWLQDYLATHPEVRV